MADPFNPQEIDMTHAYEQDPVYRRHLAGPQPGGDPGRPYRQAALRVGNQLLFDLEEIVRRHTDPDGLWEPPAYLADSGDGTGLLAVLLEQIVKEAKGAAVRAEVEAARVAAEIDARKREQIGPGYRPLERGAA